MTFISTKKKLQWSFVVFLVSAFTLVALPRSALAEQAKCYDAMAGVAYYCPAKAEGGVKVNGKADGAFAADTCYVYADPNKGWEVEKAEDCKNDGRFANIITSPQPAKTTGDEAQSTDCPSFLKNEAGGCDIVGRYLNPAIRVLSGSIGLVIAISLAIAAIQYGSSRDDPQAVAKAKKRITNAILALVTFALLYGFLEWLVPGGFLNG